MNADVEKAVESIARKAFAFDAMVAAGRISQELADESLALADGPIELTDTAAITQALRDQDAEIERLRNISDGNAELYQHEVLRTEKADALLRECRRFVAWASERLPEAMPTYEKLDAHLGGEQ